MQLGSRSAVLYYINAKCENEEAKTLRELKKRLKAEPAGTYTVYQRCGPEHREHPNATRIINRFVVTDGKVTPAPRPSDVHAVGWLRNGS